MPKFPASPISMVSPQLPNRNMYLCMYITQFCKKRYINGIAAQKFDYNMRNKHGKISIVEQYRKIIVLMNMDIKFFEARSI